MHPAWIEFPAYTVSNRKLSPLTDSFFLSQCTRELWQVVGENTERQNTLGTMTLSNNDDYSLLFPDLFHCRAKTHSDRKYISYKRNFRCNDVSYMTSLVQAVLVDYCCMSVTIYRVGLKCSHLAVFCELFRNGSVLWVLIVQGHLRSSSFAQIKSPNIISY